MASVLKVITHSDRRGARIVATELDERQVFRDRFTLERSAASWVDLIYELAGHGG
jgi:hypothetical protein